ncbi:MAG: polymer-forming cytoskeletal protein, partial [Rhodocyclaceae bacterium]
MVLLPAEHARAGACRRDHPAGGLPGHAGGLRRHDFLHLRRAPARRADRRPADGLRARPLRARRRARPRRAAVAAHAGGAGCGDAGRGAGRARRAGRCIAALQRLTFAPAAAFSKLCFQFRRKRHNPHGRVPGEVLVRNPQPRRQFAEPHRHHDRDRLRVEGDIVFTGVLRIQGDVLGNVACQGDAGDTVVVDATGSVTGTVGAPRIVVRGRVLGPLHSAQSIDIQQGGSVVGDAFYKEIVIHAGGVVEGALMPALPVDAAGEVHAGSTRQAAAPELPPPAANATPDAGGESFVARFGGWGALGGAALL